MSLIKDILLRALTTDPELDYLGLISENKESKHLGVNIILGKVSCTVHQMKKIL